MQPTASVLATYAAICQLAEVRRHNNVTFDAKRPENVAEHSYSLAALAGALAHDFNQNGSDQAISHALDIGKVTQYAVVHDLVEAFMDEGDISVYTDDRLLSSKQQLEAAALLKLKAQVPHSWIMDTIEAYESRQDDEARFVYALDKLVVHMNVIVSGQHHAKPTFADYTRTEAVARGKLSQAYPGLLPYFDDLCATFHATPHFFSDQLGNQPE